MNKTLKIFFLRVLLTGGVSAAITPSVLNRVVGDLVAMSQHRARYSDEEASVSFSRHHFVFVDRAVE